MTNDLEYGNIDDSKVENNALSEIRTGSCLNYEEHFVRGIIFAFRCCKIDILLCLFAVYLQKGFFNMEKNYLNAKQNTLRICTVAMLVAAAVVLGMYSLRIGSGIKISFKFIPMVVCSAFFGPVWGGLCGGVSDFIAYLFNPAGGAYLFPISIVEFLYGVSYGLFFYGIKKFDKTTMFKVVACILLNTVVLSTFVMAYILKDLMGMTYMSAIIYRMPATLLNMVIHLVGVTLILKYVPKLSKIMKLNLT